MTSMKLTLISLLVLGTFAGLKLHREGPFHQHFVEETEFELISHILPSDGDPVNQYKEMMHGFTRMSEANRELSSCSRTDGKDYLKIFAKSVGKLGQKDDPSSITLKHFEDDCFESIKADYTKKDDEVTVTLTPSGKGKCQEVYLLGTTKNFHTVWLGKHGRPHTVRFRHLKPDQLELFEKFGLHLFRTCDSWQNFIPSLLLSLEMLVGGLTTHPWLGPVFGSKPAPWMEKANVEFIEHATGFRWQERKNLIVDLDETEVKPGDFLAITRMDGIDQLIHYGAGSHSGHSAVIMEVDGEIVVLESQDGWYWPKHGIQRNTWAQWKKWANNAGFNVAVLPLSAESRAKFDVKKAEAWFKTMEGFPYGYHNFLFGWVDTAKDNFPPILDPDFAVIVFAILEHIIPKQITQFFGEALNQRLKTKDLKISEVTVELANRGLSWGDMWSQVEDDSWVYSDGPSMVCSAFTAGIYKAGGLFEGLEIQATEFTPKDVYTLNFFDKAPVRPSKCLQADPNLPYCQIMGKFLMELPGYSTIEPYNHMCERCPTVPPEYNRPVGC